MLAVAVMCGTLMGNYQEAQAAEIVAGIGALEIIEGILLSFGFSVMTSEMIGTLTKDPDAAKQEEWNEIQAAFWQDQLEAQYESARKKKMESPSPTPEPDDDNKDKTIPTFKELMQKYKDTGKIVLGSAAGYGVWDCMKEAVGNLWDKIFGTVSQPVNDVPEDIVNEITASGYPYYLYAKFWDGDRYLYCLSVGSFINGNNLHGNTGFLKIFRKNGTISVTEYPGGVSTHACKSTSSWSNRASNLPEFSTIEEGQEWAEQQRANADKYTKENIWVHPDLQETYQNNGKLEYPQQAPQPLQCPSAENLADLAKKLNPEINPDYSPEIAPNYVQELIQKLQKDPSVNPDPNPNPNPNPNPDPNPNPNPNPNPDPDNPETPTPEEEASPYKADLREIFPFCIPFDLIHLLKVFEADAEAPVFEFPLDIELDNPWTGKKVVDYHHTFELDMSDYEPVVKILRIFQVVFFIIALMLITRQQMIKG